LDLTLDGEQEEDHHGGARRKSKPVIDESDFPVQDDLDLDLTWDAEPVFKRPVASETVTANVASSRTTRASSDIAVSSAGSSSSASKLTEETKKADKPKSGRAFTDSGAVRSTLFESMPESVRAHLNSLEGKRVEFVIPNADNLATGRCFVEFVDVFADADTPPYVLNHHGYARCSTLHANLDPKAKKTAKETNAEKEIKKVVVVLLCFTRVFAP